MRHVRLLPAATRDVTAIWTYVSGDDDAAADALIDRFESRLRTLADHPGIGSPRPELGRRLRSVSVGHYVLIYRPVSDGIEVVRVLHGARDIRGLFRR